MLAYPGIFHPLSSYKLGDFIAPELWQRKPSAGSFPAEPWLLQHRSNSGPEKKKRWPIETAQGFRCP